MNLMAIKQSSEIDQARAKNGLIKSSVLQTVRNVKAMEPSKDKLGDLLDLE
jgi:hypothetical protein